MATNDKMRAWLEGEKYEFFGGPKWRENPDLPFWMKKANEKGERRNIMINSILAALERKKPTISKMPDGWWLHLTGKDGKMADVYLGPEHGPIVESVLNDNAAREGEGEKKQ